VFVLVFVSVVVAHDNDRKRAGKRAKAANPPAQDIETQVNGWHTSRPTWRIPPPEYLLEEAMKEPDRKLLEEYYQTITVLRDNKRFSFREISGLAERIWE